ncbi:acyltransferase family protein [Sinomonas humi]|uniref:acyltransferase family protein n=1 Tax=Sinomonas humi TaxID=1338436 RepID=UPI00068D408D|nr:acyltransferase [Sinomonas humi]
MVHQRNAVSPGDAWAGRDSQDKKRKRLESLTSLRFFAATAVALMHGLNRYDLPVVNLGFVGVSFFFVLSGFVLTWSDSTVAGTAAFLRNRFAKLFPLSAATLAIAAVVPVAPNSSRLSFLQSLTLTQAWRPSSATSFNPVTWSLSAEAFFYLLLPALLAVLRRLNARELTAAVVLLAVLQPAMWLVCQLTLGVQVGPWAGHFFTYDFPPYRLPEFAIGVALALLLEKGHTPSQAGQLAVMSFATAGAALALTASFLHFTPYGAIDALVLPAIIVLIWTAALRELTGTSRFLAHPRLVALGNRSFSFYMVHYLVLGAVGLLIGLGPQDLPWWLVPPALLTAAAIAGLAYRFVENPCGRAIRDLFSGKTAPAPASTSSAGLPDLGDGQPAEAGIGLSGRDL